MKPKIQSKKKKSAQNFKRLSTIVLEKITELRDCKHIVSESIVDLSVNSNQVLQILRNLEENVLEMERRRKMLQFWGVAATTLGSTVAAALWAMAYIDYDNFSAPVAMGATAIGVGGTVLKTANWYFSSRSNKKFLSQLDACLSSDHGKELSEAEARLKKNFERTIQILKELYGGENAKPERTRTESGRRDAESDDEESPLIISAMETVDTAACAPDVINTLFDYTADLGVEGIDALEQTYDAATASIGEVISFGILEGAANGLSVVLSSYEVYRLIGSWDKEHPTAQKIGELMRSLEDKAQVYRNTKKSIEVIDMFMRLRWNRKVKV